jgi:hypothetical protein
MNPSQKTFLRELALAAIQSVTVPAKTKFMGRLPVQAGFTTPVNWLGCDVIRPGGRDCYPAVWIQDFMMSYSSGLIPSDVGQGHLEFIATAQNGPVSRVLGNGVVIPAWSVADHINFDGSAVFFRAPTRRATIRAVNHTVCAPPPANNHFDFIWLAWLRWQEEHRMAEFLSSDYAGVPLLERLKHAFAAVETDPARAITGLSGAGRTSLKWCLMAWLACAPKAMARCGSPMPSRCERE